jgi:hypothetical protein
MVGTRRLVASHLASRPGRKYIRRRIRVPTKTVEQQLAEQLLNGTVRISPKSFSTGSVGFIGKGRPVLNGKKYIITGFNIVEVGSKERVNANA